MSTPTDLIPIGCLHERVNEQGDRYLTGSPGAGSVCDHEK